MPPLLPTKPRRKNTTCAEEVALAEERTIDRLAGLALNRRPSSYRSLIFELSSEICEPSVYVWFPHYLFVGIPVATHPIVEERGTRKNPSVYRK